ncbi:MAG: sigma-54 factor interaction domain-containing protein [Polyangiaceae bacterium]|nr:sigma-54 factor interaction domain-containing protein [Polyangiaceae bacterium]
MARKRPEGGRPGALPPAGPSRYPLADQLSAAADDLLARQARPDVVKRELVRIAEELFPGRAVVEDGGERASSSAAGPIEHWFEITEPGGKPLRLGVGGKVDERELEGLRELTSAARRGLTASIARASEPSAYADEPDVLPELPDFVAAAPVMRELRRSIAKLSGSRSTILINGESGAGKEVVARAIHDLSARARRPYIAFNCASVPRDLFEGQLFGHKKGAFTGAHADNLGVIRAAEKGTLFLDEIGELPLDVQPKLLRFFENGEVFPLGERASIKVDVRVVAATHRELSEDALVSLTDYAWPGNVRELRNVLERTMAFTSTSTVLTSSDLRFA